MKVIFFALVLGIVPLVAAQANLGCTSPMKGGSVIKLNESRCASIITPADAKRPMPVLFWFHGAGGNAMNCGFGQAGNLGKLAQDNGFALICGAAPQLTSAKLKVRGTCVHLTRFVRFSCLGQPNPSNTRANG